ncbi:MAG: hypothetical protein ACYCTK_10840, partial [Acidithiobacillus ferrooxidans]
TVLKRLLPRFTAIVTSFENMLVSPLDDCLRCILATGGKEHTEGAENPQDAKMILFCLGKSLCNF